MPDAILTARVPRWMPIGSEPDLCPAGTWWDAIRVPELVGRRAVVLVEEQRLSVGPVILDAGGREPRMYFLTPVGTAARWEEVGTVALGASCHVVLPPVDRTVGPGLHWFWLPARPHVLTPPDVLRRALVKARREHEGTL
ncbi:hypothetical protein [Streptomyces noursei]|uniref:hypothetical protein n=1 Tax=Streptomyces noursei TaxID=1971 RepID=UPI00167341DC|nr:hypothetical protein [Streptomyces noursei]MCZ1019795.1 hypothetical protein [Streptomyces noursei]GGX36581.1 hypothetical protein GCM10010341_67730 [Streptomyces noursei]